MGDRLSSVEGEPMPTETAGRLAGDTTKSRITLDPAVPVGKPVVRSTRILVEFVLDLMAQGWNEADILQSYPHLARADIQACVADARDLVAAERVFPSAA